MQVLIIIHMVVFSANISTVFGVYLVICLHVECDESIMVWEKTLWLKYLSRAIMWDYIGVLEN